jgi:phosphoglycerol transferase MdoB-like AlkP superfamily enzyme
VHSANGSSFSSLLILSSPSILIVQLASNFKASNTLHINIWFYISGLKIGNNWQGFFKQPLLDSVIVISRVLDLYEKEQVLFEQAQK